ncbi:hypothetical protein Pst134EB_012355 [Puccinia striiformis f. sp. tritici]|nr:hypothetical protein Pst134EB_012355 [Puccinia striiformis f. sp. tritici]
MPSHRRRNSLPTSYKVPITQPSFSPIILFYNEKSATQYLKKIVRDVKLGGGIITLAQLGRLRIHFEEITHFLISNGFSTHPDEFTVYFWNCLSPQLISAMSDALIWDGHMILADIYSIETLPPYNILIQYIHRCYSFPDNPKETPSRIYITSPENQQSNQNYSTHSSMEERETEDQSPVIDFADSVSLDISSSEPLTPVDITNEKAKPEGNISQNFSEEQESVLESVEETQFFNINAVDNLPAETIITEEHSFGEDHLYFPECHSQSEWEFQFILSKTSSLNLLETINPLHFMPEEPFLTKSEDQDYISPYLIPSSPAFTKALEISTSQSLQEENHVQKDPGKNSEQMIKPNPTNQQDSSCDSIQLPTSKMDKSDLQFVKPTGRSLNGLTPLNVRPSTVRLSVLVPAPREDGPDEKRAGELAPKLEAAKSHQDGQLLKPPTKTLALRIADPKDDIVRKLASRITDTLVEGELARDLPMIYMSAMLTRSFHGRLNQPRNERGRSICLKAKHSQRAEFLNESIRLYFDILFSIKRSLDQSLDQSSLSINNLISHHNYLLQRRPRNRS